MKKNPYFLNNNSEQRLIEDITRETISAMGRPVYYIPRQNFNKDYLFGEDPISKFKGSYKITTYVNSVTGFDGQGDIISKFGLELRDRVELVLSKKDFDESITRSDGNLTRPREGDLIYFTDSDTIFEINFVEHENPFYALGKLYTYVLSCEAFTYSNEEFDTDQSFIDDISTDTTTNAYDLLVNTDIDFIIGEPIFHIIGNGPTGPTAAVATNANGLGEVYNWNSNKKELIIGNQTGNFNIVSGEYIFGISSGASAEITSIVDLDLKVSKSPETGDFLFDSQPIQKEANSIFDFTDKDPFSEGNY